VRVQAAPTTPETFASLKGQYALAVLEGVLRGRGRILSFIGSVSDSSVVGILGNKLCNIRGEGSAIAYVYLHYLHTRLGVS
jgi:hypothetical protein